MRTETDAGADAPGHIALSVRGLKKTYGAVAALTGVDISVRRGEFLTLLGPSGSGKTTLLRAIAGFETPDSGAIVLEGRDVSRQLPSRRDIGMVFQNYALFPHMSVAENIAFPLRMRSVPRAAIATRVEEVLRMVDLAGYGARTPRQLSGGQQQRVALARAVVFQPKLLLLDEPFGALDRKLREGMQDEVRALQKRLDLTTVFITHDQEEALVMSDRIAVMRHGSLQQVGLPEDVYARPANVFTADFIGESSLLPGRILARDGATATLALEAGITARATVETDMREGQDVMLLVRPEKLHPAQDSGQGLAFDNKVVGRVVDVVYLGNAVKCRLLLDGGTSLTMRMADSGPRLLIGARLAVGWNAADGHVLRPA